MKQWPVTGLVELPIQCCIPPRESDISECEHSDRVTSPLGRVLSATGARCILCSRWGLYRCVGSLCDTCTHFVEELVATGRVNWFLTRSNRGRTLLTIFCYDFEWHVLGLLCNIFIKLGQATYMCQTYATYSFVTTQALFSTKILYNYDKLSYFH